MDTPVAGVFYLCLSTHLLREFASETSHLSDVQKLFESDKRRTLSCLSEFILLQFLNRCNEMYSPLTVDAGQYQHATELAERFEDFRVLVQLCEDTGNRGKLAEYMQRYKAQVTLSIIV